MFIPTLWSCSRAALKAISLSEWVRLSLLPMTLEKIFAMFYWLPESAITDVTIFYSFLVMSLVFRCLATWSDRCFARIWRGFWFLANAFCTTLLIMPLNFWELKYFSVKDLSGLQDSVESVSIASAAFFRFFSFWLGTMSTFSAWWNSSLISACLTSSLSLAMAFFASQRVSSSSSTI